MVPKRAAKKAAPPPPPPPPADSSDEETQSRSRSEDSEDEEALAESPIPAATPVLNNTPAPAHKGDESESSDEEDEEEEEEEEEPAPAAPAVPKNQPPPPQKKVDSNASGSDEEEEEDDDEEEEEEEPTRAAPPSAPKKQPPQDDSDTSGDEEEEEEEEAPQSPPEPAPKKVAEVPKPRAAAGTKKKGPFERMWSTNDDVRILEALAAHQKQHGTLPQPEALVDVLAGKLDKSAYGSKELQNKVKSLRTRYLILSKRGQLPSKEHDRRVLELSKLVWTSTDKTFPVVDAAANAVNGHEPKGFQEMCELYPHLAEEVKGLEAAHPGMCKREFGKMDDGKARAMDEKIKKQRVMQIKVEMRHADLIKEVTKALLDLVDS
ncbi:nucleolar and coiled-body phosphoprotein 1-like [Lolium rigidum]|uniref:nucleolar and coiled-body phosphoprotein 1-like n=1 Tax=Lolium rigidum TaxID=89674 RepID=UPI001F5DF610|nr:nucleolar and coiled-body phosphoprotein 1-like [Lolium rigidum]